MEKLILQFVSCARAADLRVSTAEVQDCLSQIRLIDILDERQFRSVLRANFAKSRREQHRFDHLYRLFFHELQVHDAAVGAASLATPMEAIGEVLQETAGDQRELNAVIDFMTGAPAAYLQLLQEIQTEGNSRRQGPGSNLGALVRRFPVLRALDRAAEQVDRHLNDRREDLHWEIRQQVQRHVKQRLDLARGLLTREETPEVDNIRRDADAPEKGLAGLCFSALSPAETIRLREAIAQLVRKLKDTLGLRYAARSRGVLDVKKTLRRAARYQGIPVDIVFKKKPPRKARIVVLCDISGSVWSSAKFMLNILYSLQECFDRVRSFVFVAEVAEVTRFFDDHNVETAIDKVLTEAGINYGASTDYGLTLRQFQRRHMDAVNKKTTFIVIGDGRSNYANPESRILETIRERCRRLIWLNPETEQFWYTGDSEMRTYQPLCNEVRPCRNLNQLSTFIKELML
jgi:uncharacterized protein with von Willebrand factor type A (vWA) domain